MAVTTLYTLHGILNSSTFISQIDSARPTPNSEFLDGVPAGFPYALFTSHFAVNPDITFETPQIKTILDMSGAVSSIVDLSGANTDLYFKKIADLGRRVADATAEHKRFRCAQAYLSLGQITAGDRTRAVASCRLGTTYNGSTAPMVAAGTTAISGTPTAAQHFVSGPVFYNIGGGSTQIPGVQSVTIDFGRQLIELSGDGEPYITFAAVQMYDPVITVQCAHHAWETFSVEGVALTGASIYLRKVDADGRVADGTAEHIKFAGTAGLLTVTESTGGGNDPSITTYRIKLVGADASTEPITVTTAIAITT
jgi:hypothetical protein